MVGAVFIAVIGLMLLLSAWEIHRHQGQPGVTPTSASARLGVAAAGAACWLPLTLRLRAWPLAVLVAVAVAAALTVAAVRLVRSVRTRLATPTSRQRHTA